MSSFFTFILHDFSVKSGKCGSIIVTFGRGLRSLLPLHLTGSTAQGTELKLNLLYLGV